MFGLLIRFHAREEHYLFASPDAALKEMAELESRIGKKWYGKNGDDEHPTYRFKHAVGEATVTLEKVESVAFIDPDLIDASNETGFDRLLAQNIRQKVKEKQAKIDAGLIDTPAAPVAA